MISSLQIQNSIESEKPPISCRRCGACCIKGGPSMHIEDKNLIESGRIGLKYLYTIRQGELAHDNVRGRLAPVSSDIIKIKGQKKKWTCVFFDTADNACLIYDSRPLECRALNCRNTQEIEQRYCENRLTREELIRNVAGLWDIVQDHHARCNYDDLHHLIRLTSDEHHRRRAQDEILDMVRYDADIRSLVVSKGKMDTEITDFLFGRPLSETLRPYVSGRLFSDSRLHFLQHVLSPS
jgi:Fe-S-cluster containining protein